MSLHIRFPRRMATATFFLAVSLASCKSAGPTGPTNEVLSEPRQSEPSGVKNWSALERLLAVDQFHYYLTEIKNHFGERHPVAKKTHHMTPAWLNQQDATMVAKMRDPEGFDQLVSEMTGETFAWDNKELKKTLTRSFAVRPAKSGNSMLQVPDNPTPVDVPHKLVQVPVVDPKTMTLDSDHYMSNRTTRALFWDVVQGNRRIEFYLGTHVDFVETLFLRGGKILAEIKPVASNYNKMYLTELPGHKGYVIAINRITGRDRLMHLIRQIGLTVIDPQLKRNPQVFVFGDPEDTKRFHEKELLSWIKGLPDPDHYVLGQKGGIESIFLSAARLEALRNSDSSSEEVRGQLAKFIDQNNDTLFLPAHARAVGPIFKSQRSKLKISVADPFFFRAENPSFTMADLLFKTRKGEIKRWRLISNVWGDEMIPIAKAISANAKRVTYIGTAGAFPGHGYEVGDVVMPRGFLNADVSDSISFPARPPLFAGQKNSGRVIEVTSLYDETMDWLNWAKGKGDLVELETFHLAKHSKTRDLSIFLMVSDILTGESLDKADPRKRVEGKNKLLASLFNREGAYRAADGPADFERTFLGSDPAVQKIRQLKQLPPKNKLTRYWLRQMAKRALRAGKALQVAEMQKLVKAHGMFSLKDFNKNVPGLATDLTRALLKAGLRKDGVRFHISSSYLDGTWNPRSRIPEFGVAKVEVEIAGSGAAGASGLASEVSAINKRYRGIDISLKGASGAASGLRMVDAKTCQYLRTCLVEIYTRNAYKNAGLLANFGRTGTLSFIQLPMIPRP